MKHNMTFKITGKWVKVAVLIVFIVAAFVVAICCLTNADKLSVKTSDKENITSNKSKEGTSGKHSGGPVTLTVCWELSSFSGEQTGWFADILQERFGVKMDIQPTTFLEDYQQEADIILFDNIYNKDYQKMLHEGNLWRVWVSQESSVNDKVIAINKNSHHKKVCQEVLKYINSPKGMMEQLYGPEGICWNEVDGIVQLTDLGNRCVKDSATKIPSDSSKPESFMNGNFKLAYYPYNWTYINPNTSNPYCQLSHASSVNTMHIGENVTEFKEYYSGPTVGKARNIKLDEKQIKIIKKWLDSLVLYPYGGEKDTYYPDRKTEDDVVILTMKHGKYKELVYFPTSSLLTLDGKWYSIGNGVLPILPSESIYIGTEKDSTIFYYNDIGYDVEKMIPDKEMVAIQDYVFDDKYVVLTCIDKDNTYFYVVFDKAKKDIVKIIDGCHFMILNNNVEDGLYAKEDGIYAFDGKPIKKLSLSDSQYVINISREENGKLTINVVDWKSGEYTTYSMEPNGLDCKLIVD